MGPDWYIDCRPADRLFRPSAEQLDKFLGSIRKYGWITGVSAQRDWTSLPCQSEFPSKNDFAEWLTGDFQLGLEGISAQSPIQPIIWEGAPDEEEGQYYMLVNVYNEPAPADFLNVADISVLPVEEPPAIWEQDQPEYVCKSCGDDLSYEVQAINERRIFRQCPTCGISTDFCKYPVIVGNVDGTTVEALPFVSTFRVAVYVTNTWRVADIKKGVRASPELKQCLKDSFENNFFDYLVAE